MSRGAIVAACLALAACASRTESESESDQTQSAWSVTSCTGTFDCPIDGATTRTTLRRDGDACYAGTVRLDADGRADVSGAAWTWSATEKGFSMCSGDASCITCTGVAPPATKPKPAKEKSCQGAPPSCSGRVAGTCAGLRGCYAGWHVLWNGDLQFVCKGSAHACDSFDDESSCERQSGCRWE